MEKDEIEYQNLILENAKSLFSKLKISLSPKNNHITAMGEKKESQKSIKRLENIPVFSRVQETSDNLLNFSLNESRSDCNEQNVNVESSIP